MDFNKNYYKILDVNKNSSLDKIKKNYHKLCLKYHPDTNGGRNNDNLNKIIEAYSVLSDNNKKSLYDNKSLFGKNSTNLKNIISKNKKLNIQIDVDYSNFKGFVEYTRLVICNKCEGKGVDENSKIEVKNIKGEVIKRWEADSGCDFCLGCGKDEYNNVCSHCGGLGKVGINKCNTCKGNGLILGKQKITNINKANSFRLVFKSMGNFSKSGEVGNLILIFK